jgi:antitoxin component YwqK of YwqJK toxin-antitoxin module
VVERYPDGRPKKVIEYLSKSKYYERDLYENGKIENEKFFEDGLQSGWQFHYSEDGLKRAEMHFKNGSRNGVTHEFHRNGKMGFEGYSVNGKFEGLSTWFFDNGQVEVTGNRHLSQDTGWWFYFNRIGDTIKRSYRRSLSDTSLLFDGKGKMISLEEWQRIE